MSTISNITAQNTSSRDTKPLHRLGNAGASSSSGFSDVLSQTDEARHASSRDTRGAASFNLFSMDRPTNGIKPRVPSWYGQYGDMTRFVPSSYKDPSFTLPTLPTRPDTDRSDFAKAHPELGVKALNAAWKAELSSRDAGVAVYNQQMQDMRASLNANFDALPEDVKAAALQARDTYLATT